MSEVKCIFCEFQGTLEALRLHSAECEGHPLHREVADLRARRDFLLESNNRLVEERRAAEAALAGKNVAIAVDPAERRTKVRDPRKDPQPGDVLSDCLGLHFVVQRQPELVTFIRPGWDTAHSISLRDWKKWTPKSTEVLHVAGE